MKNKPTLYALHPGWIRSINDGTRHYIGPHKLIRLYKVRSEDCILWEKNRNREDYIHLFPQNKAENYNLNK